MNAEHFGNYMLRDYHLIRELTNLLNNASDEIGNKLISMNKSIDGREEEITAQLRSELTLHLMEQIERVLGGVTIKGVKFDVFTYKRKEENKLGADLLGILTLNVGTENISKAYLAQAKVGHHNGTYIGTDPVLRFYNKDVLIQVKNMLKVTSDSFVFIYSPLGIYVIPALEVKLFNSNSISTDHFYYHKFGKFYEEFFKCFIGDHKITGDDVSPEDLPGIAEDTGANNAILIKVTIPG